MHARIWKIIKMAKQLVKQNIETHDIKLAGQITATNR